MRISKYYNLGVGQAGLDFVDIDVVDDARLFVSPLAIKGLDTFWSRSCVALLQDFFAHILSLINEGKKEKAIELMSQLREPDETHLGLSKSGSSGRGLGGKKAKDIWGSLDTSQAVKSGLLEDLEDAALMVENVGYDIVSDMTTNIIRLPLIEYTQKQCQLHGIELFQMQASPLWDPEDKKWYPDFHHLPMIDDRRLLFVPKSIVRSRPDYETERYFQHYILPAMQAEELSGQSELVETLKSGKQRVTKKSLIEKYGRGKKVVLNFTVKNPDVLDQYKARAKVEAAKAESVGVIEDILEVRQSDLKNYLGDVLDVNPGRSEYQKYEHAVEAYLTAIFYPHLINPIPQSRMHEGRKIVDLRYDNASDSGFFNWIGKHYTCPYIFIECKNYKEDVNNPELDQLAGRFSDKRGQVGLLICRSADDMPTLMKRCKDAAIDGRGYIIPVVDSDLEVLLEQRELGRPFEILRERFEYLVS